MVERTTAVRMKRCITTQEGVDEPCQNEYKRRDEEKILQMARNTRSLKTLCQLLMRCNYGNAEVERELITLIVKRLYPDKRGPGVLLEPKPAQVDVLRKLIVHQKSVWLIAKTGFGKSIILQAVSAILENNHYCYCAAQSHW
jgi:hypothetical protein